ncbi:MAG: phospho-N-acetylmuramoyl-pentapeptide-transferase, partial [Bacteroidota bacterium]
FFEWLHDNFAWAGWARLFDYITFRAGLAILLSLTISMIFGGRIIQFLRKQQVGETVRDLGLTGQMEKQGTPTMGGIIIVLAIVVPSILLNNLTNVYILLMLFATLWLASIGFMDDYIKVFKKDKKGLQGKFKILGQVVLGFIVGTVMLFNNDIMVRMNAEDAEAKGYVKEIIRAAEVPLNKDNPSELEEVAYLKAPLTNVPFLKDNELNYNSLLGFLGESAPKYIAFLFIPLIIFIVSGVSNGANLTDGLDGLATGVSAVIGGTLGVLAYVSSNTIFADYLNILYIPNSEELVIFCACFTGGCVGFLWHNAYPARVFMGDTGSLMLGGVIATMAVLIRKELLIPILCGIFLVENLSVILQVSYFKYTKKKYGAGRRIFLMSPLHHHYQKKGMHEAKIVARFWIVAVLLAVLTIITLKLR